MHLPVEPSPPLLYLAASQGGVLTAEQAGGYGLGRSSVDRLITSGRWSRVTRGTLYTRPGPPPWVADAWAGVLLGGPESRIGGLAAAHLDGLRAEPPARIEVLTGVETRHRSRDRWTFVRERSTGRGPSVGSPPRLRIEDIVIGLCASMTEADVVDLVTTAVQTRRTTPERLLAGLDRRRAVGGRALLLDLLGDVAAGAQSALETKYLRDVERPHGLPRGTRQHRRGADFRDVLYEEFTTVVELDGIRGHLGTGRFRDMRRDNRATLAGEATLRFGWHDVLERPCASAELVAAVLGQRGWSGAMRRCRSCG